MRFDLVRPCAHCPFRKDIRPFLTQARALEISRALYQQGSSFTCHETNDYDDEDTVETPESQHCAGAMIMLERAGKPNQMMRWMERIGRYDPKRLDMASPVYARFHDFIAAQKPRFGKPPVTAIYEKLR